MKKTTGWALYNKATENLLDVSLKSPYENDELFVLNGLVWEKKYTRLERIQINILPHGSKTRK